VTKSPEAPFDPRDMKTTTWVVLAIAVIVGAAPRTSDAEPAPTCKAACQRFTDCKMPSYTKMCVDSCKQYGYEASDKGRAQLVTMTRYSCKQLQDGVAAMSGAQQQRSSPRNGAPPTPSAGTGGADEAELDKLEKEAADLEKQLDNDTAELERRSRNAQGPARKPAGPAPTAPPRGADNSARTRRPAASGSGRWTCNAQGSSVDGFDVESGRGDVQGHSTVSIPGNGNTKDEAASQAMSSCGSLMTVNLSHDRAMHLDGSSEGQWGVRVDVACHVTKCAPN